MTSPLCQRRSTSRLTRGSVNESVERITSTGLPFTSCDTLNVADARKAGRSAPNRRNVSLLAIDAVRLDSSSAVAPRMSMSAARGSLRAEFTWISPNPKAWAAPGSERAIINTNGFCPRDIFCSKYSDHLNALGLGANWANAIRPNPLLIQAIARTSTQFTHVSPMRRMHLIVRRHEGLTGPAPASKCHTARTLRSVPSTRCDCRKDRRRRYDDSPREAHLPSAHILTP